MDFLIELEDGRFLKYETDPASLIWDDGALVDLSKFAYKYIDTPHTDNDQIPFSVENPVIGKTKPRILKIQLGLGCNYSCSYCSQSRQKEEPTNTRDAEDFDFSWVDGALEKVELWGGEPLLYWKKIQILVPKIRKKFGNVRISLVTNGVLLTREKIDWLFDNGFTLAISHDGPGQSVRGDDPLKNHELLSVWQYAFKKFKDRISVNSVITAKNYDLFKMWMWFEERFGAVKLNVEDIVTDYGGASMTDDELMIVYESIKKYASSGLALVFPRIRWAMQQFLETLAIKKSLKGSHQVCGMDRKDYIAVDLKGNVLTCQNVGAQSGHVIGRIDALDEVKLDTSTSFMNRPHCNECPVVHLCYGSCMFLTGKDFDSSCRASYWYNRALLEGVITLLTDKRVCKIHGWQPVKYKRVISVKSEKCSTL